MAKAKVVVKPAKKVTVKKVAKKNVKTKTKTTKAKTTKAKAAKKVPAAAMSEERYVFKANPTAAQKAVAVEIANDIADHILEDGLHSHDNCNHMNRGIEILFRALHRKHPDFPSTRNCGDRKPEADRVVGMLQVMARAYDTGAAYPGDVIADGDELFVGYLKKLIASGLVVENKYYSGDSFTFTKSYTTLSFDMPKRFRANNVKSPSADLRVTLKDKHGNVLVDDIPVADFDQEDWADEADESAIIEVMGEVERVASAIDCQ